MKCRVCNNQSTITAGQNKWRKFCYCDRCGLVFVPEQYWISVEEEKKRYEQHNNTPENEGYLKFLKQIVDVVCDLRRPSARILDFGSGGSAVLTILLTENGFDCTAYDPLFNINIDNDGSPYDIIILCEVIEHLRNIEGEMKKIKNLLKKDGILIIRTRLYPSVEKIENWWYAQDKTHINFFTTRTIDKIARIINRQKVLPKAEDIFVIE
jgi:SAM-dependent methyltransferase